MLTPPHDKCSHMYTEHIVLCLIFWFVSNPLQFGSSVENLTIQQVCVCIFDNALRQCVWMKPRNDRRVLVKIRWQQQHDEIINDWKMEKKQQAECVIVQKRGEKRVVGHLAWVNIITHLTFVYARLTKNALILKSSSIRSFRYHIHQRNAVHILSVALEIE